MYKFGIKRLDGSLFGFHPYYSSLKIYPQESIIEGETRCFYVNCSWSDGYGTTFRPDYEIHLFPIEESVDVRNIIDSNFEGNFEVKKDSIMIKKYF